jgi:hypothetical protein
MFMWMLQNWWYFMQKKVCIHIWKCYMDYLFHRESLIENVNITLMYWMFNSSDDDFIEASLGGMGYSCRSYKKWIPNCKFIRGWFQTIFLKMNILQVVVFQNVLIDPKILKEKTNLFIFFNVFSNICVLQKQIWMFTCNCIQM